MLRSSQIAIVAFVCLLLCLPRFFMEHSRATVETTKVVIENPVTIKTMSDKKTSDGANSMPPATSKSDESPESTPASETFPVISSPTNAVSSPDANLGQVATPAKPTLPPNTLLTEASQKKVVLLQPKNLIQIRTEMICVLHFQDLFHLITSVLHIHNPLSVEF